MVHANGIANTMTSDSLADVEHWQRDIDSGDATHNELLDIDNELGDSLNSGSATSRMEVITKLEDIILSSLIQLHASSKGASETWERDFSLLENSRMNNSRDNFTTGHCVCIKLADRRKTTEHKLMATRSLRFPSKSRMPSAKPIAQLLRVLDIMHQALVDNVPLTKRDMYYRDVTLFKSQSVVDRLVDDVAATFAVGRSDLNVRASPKGLVCGSSLMMHLKNGESIACNDSEGTLIPVSEDIARYEVSDVLKWILVVEKEAVFQTLCRLSLTNLNAELGRGIMITGKGYPDLATRGLVKTLADNLAMQIPIVALVDGDPYGIDILRVFIFGSRGMNHEVEKLASGSRLEGIGLWASDLLSSGVNENSLLPITIHDEKKARQMLMQNTSMPWIWKRELQSMLHTRRKAEIEILSSQSEDTSHAREDLPLVKLKLS